MTITETLGFVNRGRLIVEPPWRWSLYQRDVWTCCARSPEQLVAERLTPIEPARAIAVSTAGYRPTPPAFSELPQATKP